MARINSLLATSLLFSIACSSAEPTAELVATPPQAHKASDSTSTPTNSPASEKSQQPPADSHRKVIYNATLEGHVDRMNDLPKEVRKLVNAAGGYIANHRNDEHHTGHRADHWKIRVPAERFEVFMDQVAGRLQVDRREVSSKDVTADYVDLKARLGAARTLEARLTKLLEDQAFGLEDILRVERELGRVRADVERLEGRLEVLADLTSMSTIVLRVHERPPAVVAGEPPFVTKLARTIEKSFGHLIVTLQSLVIVGTALIPWIPFLIIGAFLGRFGYRRLIGSVA